MGGCEGFDFESRVLLSVRIIFRFMFSLLGPLIGYFRLSKLGFGLTFLQDPMILRSTDRLIAFAIMHQCYSSVKPSLNPFVSEMINVSSLFIVRLICRNANLFVCLVLYIYLIYAYMYFRVKE